MTRRDNDIIPSSMNISTTFKINVAFNPKYSHCTKLNQGLYLLFVILHQNEPELRSTDILFFLAKRFGITVTASWVNQKLKQCHQTRKRGRPTKEYTQKRMDLHNRLEELVEQVEQIGIPFLISIMDAIGLTDVFVSSLQSCIAEKPKTALPKSKDALTRFVHSLAGLTLDPRTHNFEEAFRTKQTFTPLSMPYTARMIKAVEGLPTILSVLENRYVDFWSQQIGLDNPDEAVVLYIDGHGYPYYTKKTFLTGRMSVTEKIAPGTHEAVVTTDTGFVLNVLTQNPNTHLNEGIKHLAINTASRIQARIQVVVVDRECNGADLMQTIRQEYGLPILSALRCNQYKKIEDFDYVWVEDQTMALADWADEEKRETDGRLFLLFPKGDGKVYVMVTTCSEDAILAEVEAYQKGRWSYCENVIKSLVNEFDFNVNVCNGTYQTPNPKIVQLEKTKKEKQAKHREHLAWIAQQQEGVTAPSKVAKLEASKLNWENRFVEADRECQTKRIGLAETVGARKLEPQGFMSYLRAGIYNLLLYLLSQVVGMDKGLSMGIERIKSMLVNRNGSMETKEDTITYYFYPPDRREDCVLLSSFLDGVNALHLKDRTDRKIQGKLSVRAP